ncbi:MAG: biosynthetic-type acetolactate synthase large subunit [Spirochaetales bacterium]|nr:biosynthetic-type acetolactate synthase large subunit [Spirochaetales bacterium]
MIVESLKKEGVDTVFCYTGGAVISIFDELYKHGEGLNLIQPRHEQGGTHAADGYARSTGKTGVVLVTSGPGATNTITGIATAYMDSSPLVVITGQVASTLIGTDAFQESDVTGITLPITKANFLVKNIKDLAVTIKKAFYIAGSGRPGPVVIDIPGDIQRQNFHFNYPETVDLQSYKPKDSGHPKQIKSALKLLSESVKPLVLTGGGVNLSNAMPEMNEFLNKTGIPVVHTLMGNGINPEDDNQFFGFIGMHGTLYGNYAIQNADLIMAVGVRFSDRIIGDPKSYGKNAKIIHIDIDPAEIGKNISVELPIVGSAKSVLKELNCVDFKMDISEWQNELVKYKKDYPLSYEYNDKIKPQAIIELAQKYFPEDTVVATDVGQNQIWVAQYYRIRQPRCFLTSGGLGTMGYGLPSAIGAAVGNPDKQVLMFAGDGGFQMNMQELGIIRKYGLKVKMIILDNNYLGMVRQWQELLFDKRYSGTDMDFNPDFVKLAEVFKIKAVLLKDPKEADRVIRELMESDESMLVHVVVDPDENVLPMVPAGKALDEVLTKL